MTPNLTEAASIALGITPLNAEPDDLILDVLTPSGAVIAIDDPALMEILGEDLRGENHLSLLCSDRPLTNCRSVSLISLQTIGQIEAEMSIPVDKRLFRANIYLDFSSGYGFAEDKLIGRRLRI